MDVLSVVMLEGRELDPESFAKLTGHEMAVGCFRCGKRVAIHLGQLAAVHLMHHFEPTMIVCCTECKDAACEMRVPDDGAELKMPPFEIKLPSKPDRSAGAAGRKRSKGRGSSSGS